MFERILEPGPRLGRHLGQVGMQCRVFRAAVGAVPAVDLEVGELAQQGLAGLGLGHHLFFPGDAHAAARAAHLQHRGAGGGLAGGFGGIDRVARCAAGFVLGNFRAERRARRRTSGRD